MNNFSKKLGTWIFSLFLTSQAYAQVAPSPAMLEQFKQLPREQQVQLAAQYGIDLSQIDGSTQGVAAPTTVEQLTPTPRAVAAAEAKADDEEAGLQRFGTKMFDASISTFAPVNNMPVPDDYVLGADDSIQVQLYGKETSSQVLVIDRDGMVQLDGVGPLQLAGITFADAVGVIKSKISEAKIGVEAAVSMGKLRTINIFIAGEAKFPGMYAVSAMTTVTQALFVSGGVTDIGSLRDVRINRAGQQVASFDLYELLLRGNNSADINLKHGDVLFVAPVQAQVTVTGLVNRPAIYELKGAESVQDVLKMAGGNKANAHLKAVTLERINRDNLRDLRSLDLTAGTDLQVKLQDGDLLNLSAISNRIENEVVLAGAVVRPGRYAYRSGMQLSDLIKGVWADLLPTVDLDYALVVREKDAKGDIQVVQINLAEVLGLANNGMGKRSFVLQPRDVVLVFHYTEDDNVQKQDETLFAGPFKAVFANGKFLAKSNAMSRRQLLRPVIDRLKRQSNSESPLDVVTIAGQVKIPGEYPIGSNSTISQIMVAAGGATDAAFMERIELSRYEGFDSVDAKFDIKNISINLAQILNKQADDLVLQSRDRINVFAKPEWAEERTVTIGGEVRFPGTYQVTRGEKMSELIARAGGFTEDAFPFGAIFTRQKVKEREQEQFNRLLQQLRSDIAAKAVSSAGSVGAPTNPEQTMGLIKQLESTEMVGRLAVNMIQIEAGNPEYDFVLEQGDKLMVPRKTRSVTVIGEVQYPSSHSFDGNLSVKDYLALAGNPRKRADEDRVYVIRADGSVLMPSGGLFSANNAEVVPGDTIVVPLDVEYKDSLSLWGQVTQIAYQAAIAVAAVNSL